MLHPDAEIVGLDGGQLERWWRLGLPPGATDARWALAVRGPGEGGFAVVAERGRMELAPEDIARVDDAALERLRRKVGVDFLAMVDAGALERLCAVSESAAARRPHYTSQWLVAYDAVRRMRGRGVWTSPGVLELLPPLHEDALRKGFDLLVPNNCALVAYIFEEEDKGGGIYASVIATKVGGVIDSVAMHPAIDDLVPGSGLRPWHKRYRAINDAVSRRFEAPSISVFTDVATVRRIMTGPQSQLSKEIAAKNLIIDPMPTWLAGLLGGAAAAMIAGKSAATLSKLLPKQARRAAGAVAGVAKQRLADSGASPLAVLGFDPIALWKSVQGWYRA